MSSHAWLRRGRRGEDKVNYESLPFPTFTSKFSLLEPGGSDISLTDRSSETTISLSEDSHYPNERLG